jgi:hypothetical protein
MEHALHADFAIVKHGRVIRLETLSSKKRLEFFYLNGKGRPYNHCGSGRISSVGSWIPTSACARHLCT